MYTAAQRTVGSLKETSSKEETGQAETGSKRGKVPPGEPYVNEDTEPPARFRTGLATVDEFRILSTEVKLWLLGKIHKIAAKHDRECAVVHEMGRLACVYPNDYPKRLEFDEAPRDPEADPDGAPAV
ncbi:hypothetical protein ACOMHN_064985 [Nucella lapillus]